MLKTLAIIFGLGFLAIGILGLMPAYAPDGMLLGIFQVNLAHNLVHLLTGVIALLSGFSGENSAKWFFRLFGLVYAAVAVHGFMYHHAPIFGIIVTNAADTWLHTGTAALFLLLGFCCCGGRCSTGRSA